MVRNRPTAVCSAALGTRGAGVAGGAAAVVSARLLARGGFGGAR